MSEPATSPETLLAAALEIGDTVEQRAYLDRACGGDAALRAEVESLLAANAAAGEFLLRPAHIGASATQKTMLLSPMSEVSGTRIGRYKLLEQIGEGGFGVVWMAEQEEPVRRRVALKIIKLGMDTKEVLARFEAERQALAMMEHPNIASVFDGGATDTGRPYFVMELVKGIPITDYCDAAKLSTRERLDLFMQVCQAVQHAHQKGIIHRDLKPSNILVTVKDDRAVPKVIDFGIAKATQARLTEKTIFTRLNQWIGTPAYMSPEQAGLGSLDVDTRSDIYSLGVLLYELLTGGTPFDTQKLLAAGYDAVMRTIREEEPPKPSTRLSTLGEVELNTVATQRASDPAKLNRLVRGDLDWIVMKALEKDRTRRYDTANDFAADLHRHLSDEPVVAAPPSMAYRLRHFVSRHRLALATGSAIALAVVAGTVVSTWQAVRATRAEKTTSTALGLAEKGRLAAEQGRRETEAALYASRVSGAYQAWEKGDVKEAENLLDSCPATLRHWEWRYLKRQCHAEIMSFSVIPTADAAVSEAVRSLDSPPGGGHIPDFHAQLAFLPDDQRLGVRFGGLAEFGSDLPAVFALSTGTNVPLNWTPNTNSTVVLAADGSRLVALPNADAVARVLDLKTAKLSLLQVESASSECIANDDASWLALSSSNGVAVVGLAADSARRFIVITNITRHQVVSALQALSPDGTTLVRFSDNPGSHYQVWDTVNGKVRFEIPIGRVAPYHFRFDQRGRRLAVCGQLEGPSGPGDEVAVWDVTSGQRLFIRRKQPLSTKLWFTRDDQWLILAPPGVLAQHPSTDLIIVDAASGLEVSSFVADNAVQHAGRVMWAGKPAEGGVFFPMSGVNDVAVSPNGDLMALAVTDRTVHLISLVPRRESRNVRTPNLRSVLRGHRGAVLGVAFSRDGKRLASIDQMGVVKVWEPTRTLATELGEDWQRNTSVSGDATQVVWTDSRNRASYALNLTTGERTTLPKFPVFDHRQVRVLDNSRIAVTSDGRRVAVCADGEPNVVQVRWTGVAGDTPGLITSFPGRRPVLFGPKGDWLLAYKSPHTFQCVDSTTGKVLRDFKLRSRYGSLLPSDTDSEKFDFPLQGWELSPNGRFAVCFDYDADFPVVDLLSGEVVFEIGWSWLGAGAAFTPDGRRLLATGPDQRVGIWDLETKSRIVTLPWREVFIRFTRDGNRAVVINFDGQISVLDGTPLEAGQ